MTEYSPLVDIYNIYIIYVIVRVEKAMIERLEYKYNYQCFCS